MTLLSRLSIRYGKLFENGAKDYLSILNDLEKKFYVSSRNESLFEHLVKGPTCPKIRQFPLKRRIGII